MPDYQKSKIYKLVCDNKDKIYYGSTVQLLCQRIAKHKNHLKSYKSGRRTHCYSFDLFELGNVKIILVENYPCESKEELLMRERYYIENNDCVNKYMPIRSKDEKKTYKKQYDIDNKDKNHQTYVSNKETISEKQKEYYKKNRDEINIRVKKYADSNRDEINRKKKIFREANKEKIRKQLKKWREDNKEEIKRKKKEYYLKMKDKSK